MTYYFILFCKTYKGDFEKFKILKDSIDKFNVDKLPFYCCCPQRDVELFESLRNKKESYEYKIVTDEEVLNIKNDNLQNWRTQQLAKLNFFKLNISDYWLLLDSDCYFIRNFYLSNFMKDKNTFYLYTQSRYHMLLNNVFKSFNVSNNLELNIQIESILQEIKKKYSSFNCCIPFVMSQKCCKNMELYFEKLVGGGCV